MNERVKQIEEYQNTIKRGVGWKRHKKVIITIKTKRHCCDY